MTLPIKDTYTKQEIFDHCVNHLRTQGKQSIDKDATPRYRFRSSDGCKCPVGSLIRDDEYSPTMEGGGLSRLFDGIYSKSLTDRLSAHRGLLSWFVYVHDAVPVEKWEEELKSLAQQQGLVYEEKK